MNLMTSRPTVCNKPFLAREEDRLRLGRRLRTEHDGNDAVEKRGVERGKRQKWVGWNRSKATRGLNSGVLVATASFNSLGIPRLEYK
jgi:hypothetical protein